MVNCAAIEKAWEDVRSLRLIIEAHRDEGEVLRHLPEPIVQAMRDRDIYRLTLPVHMGGAGLGPLDQFDLIVEVARADASAGWIYWLGSGAQMIAGRAAPELTADVFRTADCAQAAALAPTGRAIAVDGGYRVSGRWAWASGIHHFRFVGGHCIVFDGGTPRETPTGAPAIVMVMVPKDEVSVLDTWHTSGMRGTGSTEFEMNDHFVPESQAFSLFAEPTLPDPIFKLPAGFFAFGIGAVALGTAWETIDALSSLAKEKRQQPGGALLAERPSTQYAVAKCQAMVEAAEAALRSAITDIWAEAQGEGGLTDPNRVRFRRALVHAVDSAIEVVGNCCREAGGSAVHKTQPFERALRDVNTIGAHVAVQRSVMEMAGGITMGVMPMGQMF